MTTTDVPAIVATIRIAPEITRPGTNSLARYAQAPPTAYYRAGILPCGETVLPPEAWITWIALFDTARSPFDRTTRDLAASLGMSINALDDIIDRLESVGLVTRYDGLTEMRLPPVEDLKTACVGLCSCDTRLSAP